MVESAALLVDEVLPHLPMRQWVLSFPFQLRCALNLNIHFHMLFLDGVYLIDRETPVFRRLPAPRKLERLCRYVARPAVATDRLAVTPQGNVRYTLKTPYRDGTTHIILEPLDFIARLAALVPKPRVNLTRFHGVFAPSCPPFGCNSTLRHHVTPAGRGKRRLDETKTPAQRRAATTGFCSCKAGIHAVHGNNLGPAPQARIQDRHRDL